MDKVIYIDFDSEIFNRLALQSMNEFSLLSEMVIEAFDQSLKNNLDDNILSVDVKRNDLTISQYFSPTNILSLSKTGAHIFYLNIVVKTSLDCNSIELKFSKSINLNGKYFKNNVSLSNRKLKRCNIFSIEIKELIIESFAFCKSYSLLMKQCYPNCKPYNLQDRVIFRPNYDWWINFECKICGKKYFCKCFENTINSFMDNFARSHCDKKLNPYQGAGGEIEDFVNEYKSSSFLKDCCHLCQDKLPHHLLGKNLIERYKPYIINEAYNLDNNFFNIQKDYYQSRVSGEVYCNIFNTASNKIRDIIGYPRIGERYKRETELYYLVKKLFDGYNIIREASPDWLKPQRLDIFIPELNIAFEYQGEQHFKPVKCFGGDEAFKMNKERDLIKKQKCKNNKINLIYVCYNEQITEDLIKAKLSKK